jgi:nucleoside-diphosphate-sugar epimerase
MESLTILGGRGFVGSEFVHHFYHHAIGNITALNARDDYSVRSKDVLYFISTIHNYNVFEDTSLDISTNLLTLMKVLDNWRARPDSKDGVFNFISSWFVYGDTPMPHAVKEDALCNPKGFYSITKHCAEQLLRSYCDTFGLHYRILRLGNVVGPGDKKVCAKKNALQYMLDRLKAGEPVEVYGDGQQFRDYIHVSDVARAIDIVLAKGNVDEVYNIGNGRHAWTLSEILSYAACTLHSKSSITSIEPKAFHTRVQVRSFYMNVQKLLALGFVPEYTGEKLFRALL